MSVTLLKPSGESVRHRTIREFVQAWAHQFPGEASEVSTFLKEQTSQQINSSGKWRAGGDGYFKVSFPSQLWHGLRLMIKRGLPGDPPFGYDDSDIQVVVKHFPDLVGGKNSGSPRKKDYRKRTLLKTDGK